MAPKFEQALHSLKGAKHVIDIRNVGLVGGVELASRAGAPGRARLRDLSQVLRGGVLVRTTGDIIALAPALIVEEAQIDQIVSTLRDVIGELA